MKTSGISQVDLKRAKIYPVIYLFSLSANTTNKKVGGIEGAHSKLSSMEFSIICHVKSVIKKKKYQPGLLFLLKVMTRSERNKLPFFIAYLPSVKVLLRRTSV